MRTNRGITANTIIEFIRAFPAATTFQIFSFLLLVANAYLAYNLNPIVQSIDSLAGKVQAINDELVDRPALVQRFVVTEQQVKDLKETLKDMQDRETRIENKIDRLLEK